MRPMPAAGPMLRMPRTSDAVSSIRCDQYSASPNPMFARPQLRWTTARNSRRKPLVGVQDVVSGRLVAKRGPGHQAAPRV